MTLDRKTFLRSLGAGALGVFAVRQLGAMGSGTEPTAPLPVWNDGDPESFWRQVRAEFPITTERTYFNTGGLGPAPRRVLEKFAATSRELQHQVETGHELFAPARETVAGYLGAKPDEVCFTRNCTEGTNIVATGLDLKAGDEVILDSQAHPGGSFRGSTGSTMRASW